MKNQWWHNKVAYQIYPKSFYDTNGDGIGDIRGIIEKLDYLKELGIDIIWISPVYPSPLKDQGYDISDYYGIDPRFGTMEDMDELLTETKKRNMYILMDLVINHCSDQHEWFLKALKDPYGKYGKYFYFEKGHGGKLPTNWRSYFGGSVWEPVPGYDELYYLHLFHKGQPDLNWENPELRQELYKMINWWLDKGIAGFRIDAIINIKKALPFRDYPADHPDGLSSIHNMLNEAKGIGIFLEEMKNAAFKPHEALTIGEVFNMKPEETADFIGDDGHFSSQFEFDHVTVGRSEKGWYDEKPVPISLIRDTVLKVQKDMEGIGYLTNIIENHDEPRGASTYIPEEDYCYESVTSLATASVLLRGLPMLYQGQEIGMKNCPFHSIDEIDDISTLGQYQIALDAGLEPEDAFRSVLHGCRDHARTPVQWTAGENAGFTTGTPWMKLNPCYTTINVEAEEKDPSSVLNYYKKLIAFRKADEHQDALIYGKTVPFHPELTKLFGYQRIGEKKTFTVLCSFSREEIRIPLNTLAPKIVLNNKESFTINGTDLILAPYQAVVLATETAPE